MASVYYKKYKRLSGWDVTNHVEKFFNENGAPLTNYQKEILKNYWGEPIGIYGDLGLPFQAYDWTSIKYKGNPLIRITLPLFVVFVVLMTFVIRPINWIFTGSWWFGTDSKIEVFCNKWWVYMFGE